MFGKTTLPQKKPFPLTPDDIAEDIEAICLDEEQRNKLYLCLDNKPPHDDQFSKVEDFLKGTDNLEDVKQKLDSLIRDVDSLIKNINIKVGDIQKFVDSVM